MKVGLRNRASIVRPSWLAALLTSLHCTLCLTGAVSAKLQSYRRLHPPSSIIFFLYSVTRASQPARFKQQEAPSSLTQAVRIISVGCTFRRHSRNAMRDRTFIKWGRSACEALLHHGQSTPAKCTRVLSQIRPAFWDHDSMSQQSRDGLPTPLVVFREPVKLLLFQEMHGSRHQAS